MTVDALNAAKAYGNQLKIMQNAGDGSTDESSGSTGGSPFMKMVQDAVKSAVNTETGSETKQLQSLTGKVELTNLTTSVANAELTLNAVVAIRDRVINAYNDIIKMSI